MKNKTGSIVFILILLFSNLAHAQGPGNGLPSDPGGGSVPIDGGLSLLVGAAVLYGAKKLKDSKKKRDK